MMMCLKCDDQEFSVTVLPFVTQTNTSTIYTPFCNADEGFGITDTKLNRLQKRIHHINYYELKDFKMYRIYFTLHRPLLKTITKERERGSLTYMHNSHCTDQMTHYYQKEIEM